MSLKASTGGVWTWTRVSYGIRVKRILCVRMNRMFAVPLFLSFYLGCVQVLIELYLTSKPKQWLLVQGNQAS